MDSIQTAILNALARVPVLMAQWGLHPETATRYALIEALLPLVGYKAPRITSGYRSLAKQRELYDRWRAGEPGIYKPARRSFHTNGLAVDVTAESSRNLLAFRTLWNAMLWGQDGGADDPIHFEIDHPLQRPTAAW